MPKTRNKKKVINNETPYPLFDLPQSVRGKKDDNNDVKGSASIEKMTPTNNKNQQTASNHANDTTNQHQTSNGNDNDERTPDDDYGEKDNNTATATNGAGHWQRRQRTRTRKKIRKKQKQEKV